MTSLRSALCYCWDFSWRHVGAGGKRDPDLDDRLWNRYHPPSPDKNALQWISGLPFPFGCLFLSARLRHGGHLLECQPRQIRVGARLIDKLELALPLRLD
jgi:hypothetical protein